MKKLLTIVTSGLLISVIPLIGTYVFHSGPEWVRYANGSGLAISCISLAATVFAVAFYILTD